MITIDPCSRCSQLLPPPPIFSLGPPPNILSLDIRCSSRLLSSPSIQHEKLTYSSSFSSLSVSVTLGIIIFLLISTGTILFIKNRMIKRRQKRQKRYDDNSSPSMKFNGHNDHRNWTKFLPLLSDSCSSDHTASTPPSECPCGIIEPLLSNDIYHEYEQIKYDSSSHNYCLVYCRQCSNYHSTSSSSSCRQANFIQTNYQHLCTCHLRNDNHLFELQPMLRTISDDLNHQPSI